MPSLQINPIRKSQKSHLRDIVDTVGNSDIKQIIVPIRKATRRRAQKGNLRKNRVLKETTTEKDIRICPKLNVTIVVNMDIMHMTDQNHATKLVLLKKVSETRNLKI